MGNKFPLFLFVCVCHENRIITLFSSKTFSRKTKSNRWNENKTWITHHGVSFSHTYTLWEHSNLLVFQNVLNRITNFNCVLSLTFSFAVFIFRRYTTQKQQQLKSIFVSWAQNTQREAAQTTQKWKKNNTATAKKKTWKFGCITRWFCVVVVAVAVFLGTSNDTMPLFNTYIIFYGGHDAFNLSFFCSLLYTLLLCYVDKWWINLFHAFYLPWTNHSSNYPPPSFFFENTFPMCLCTMVRIG